MMDGAASVLNWFLYSQYPRDAEESPAKAFIEVILFKYYSLQMSEKGFWGFVALVQYIVSSIYKAL